MCILKRCKIKAKGSARVSMGRMIILLITLFNNSEETSVSSNIKHLAPLLGLLNFVSRAK